RRTSPVGTFPSAPGMSRFRRVPPLMLPLAFGSATLVGLDPKPLTTLTEETMDRRKNRPKLQLSKESLRLLTRRELERQSGVARPGCRGTGCARTAPTPSTSAGDVSDHCRP